jgi:signal transduction histidine kinase/predicted RNA-binding protein with RPS1 domain
MLKKSELKPQEFAAYVEQHYPRWARVVGRVVKVQRFGLFIEFDDGIQGIVRRRELSWHQTDEPDQLAGLGQTLEVVVLDVDQPSRRLELSRRLVEHDPWQAFVAATQPGQVIRGQVIRVMPYGAFVELIPGVVGLVRVAEIAPWFVEHVEDVLWVGDYVQAEVLNIDETKRHVGLSIKKYLKRLEHELTQATIAAYVNKESGLSLSLGERLGLSASQLERHIHGQAQAEPSQLTQAGKILIVEDEQTLADQVEKWMFHLGYAVDTVYSGEKGVEKALAGRYSLILMDLNLPGLDGLAAARQILGRQPATPIVLMTGANLADEHGQEIEAINFTEILLKPFKLHDIEILLERLEQGEPLKPSAQLADSQHLAAEIGFFQRVSQAAEATQQGLAQALAGVLAELSAETKATAGAIFQIDPVSQVVSLLAHSGAPLAFEQSKHHLAESPVKDVALERQVLWEKAATGRHEARFRYLLPLLPFNACLGLPIEVDHKTKLALFLFHPEPDHFTTHHFQRAMATTLVLAATLERYHMEEVMRSTQRLFLVGQLSSGLAHEVNNKLASVEFYTTDLLRGFERLAQEQPTLTNTLLFRDLHRAVEAIAQMNRSVLETARMFRALTAGEEARWLNINEVIQYTRHLMEPLARKHQVTLKTNLAPDMPQTIAVGVRLQQALHNIVLNAIQQITGQSQANGSVEITSAYRPDDALQPLKIFITDDGPGIHHQYFDKIFELGFTTRRQEGTGLGLYISRGLIESLGGRLTISDSVMLIGTTFVLELPLVTEEVA